MKKNIFPRLARNFKTRKDWGVALTAFVPVALVFGRSAADFDVSIVAILFLLDSFLSHKWNWTKQAWICAALLLWYYCVLRAAVVPDGGEAWRAAVVWVRYIVFAASVPAWALAEKRGRLWLARACVASVLFLSVDGLIQYVFGHDIIGNGLLGNRLTGVYNRPIFGMTISNLFAPAIFWLLERKHVYKAILLSSTCLAAVLMIVESSCSMNSAQAMMMAVVRKLYVRPGGRDSRWMFPSCRIRMIRFFDGRVPM